MDRTNRIADILKEINVSEDLKGKCVQYALDLKSGRKNLKELYNDAELQAILPEVQNIYKTLYGQKSSDINFWEVAEANGKIKKLENRKFYYDPTNN